MLRIVIDRFGSPLLLRYLAASASALAVDVGTFLFLLGAGMIAPAASAIGFSLGIAVHWLMSSRMVFAATTAPSGADRWRQKLLFLMSAGVGLVLTVAIVTAGQFAGLDPRLAKLAAIAVSFTTTYAIRRTIVFTAR